MKSPMKRLSDSARSMPHSPEPVPPPATAVRMCSISFGFVLPQRAFATSTGLTKLPDFIAHERDGLRLEETGEALTLEGILRVLLAHEAHAAARWRCRWPSLEPSTALAAAPWVAWNSATRTSMSSALTSSRQGVEFGGLFVGGFVAVGLEEVDELAHAGGLGCAFFAQFLESFHGEPFLASRYMEARFRVDWFPCRRGYCPAWFGLSRPAGLNRGI